MCTVLPIAAWLSEGTILVSSHKTMSTVAILVRNTIVKITNHRAKPDSSIITITNMSY